MSENSIISNEATASKVELNKIWTFHLKLVRTPITNFCPGNTVWLQATGFQKLPKIRHFCSLLKCKRSFARSQCWMRLFLWLHSVYPCKLRKISETFIIGLDGDIITNRKQQEIWFGTWMSFFFCWPICHKNGTLKGSGNSRVYKCTDDFFFRNLVKLIF